MLRRTLTIAILLVAGSCAALANSLNFQFSGNFSKDNDVQLFTVTLAVPEVLTAWTTSGASGGFPTYLAMFDGAGNGMVQQSGDPTCKNGFSNYSSAGLCNDAMVSEPPAGVIAAGTYYIALTQWDNGMVGDLPDGFFWVDIVNDPNYTAQYCATAGYFCDPFTGTHNTSDWAVTIQLSLPGGTAEGSAAPVGQVPEPGTLMLALVGVSATWCLRRRA